MCFNLQVCVLSLSFGCQVCILSLARFAATHKARGAGRTRFVVAAVFHRNVIKTTHTHTHTEREPQGVQGSARTDLGQCQLPQRQRSALLDILIAEIVCRGQVCVIIVYAPCPMNNHRNQFVVVVVVDKRKHPSSAAEHSTPAEHRLMVVLIVSH